MPLPFHRKTPDSSHSGPFSVQHSGSVSVRFGIFDFIRGLALLYMIAYHSLWNLVYFYGFRLPWFQGLPGAIWQLSGCSLFILLSGFCWSFGRRALRRGIEVFLAGALVSLVTGIFMPMQMVRFGILTLLGSCMLLTIPVHYVMKQRSALAGLALSLLLFMVFFPIGRGFLGFGSMGLIPLPNGLYQGSLAAYLGLTPTGFSSTDYFPLLPWLFLFWAGYFLYRLVFHRVSWPDVSGRWSAPFRFLGRHSLLVYLLHQPVIYGLMALLLDQ